MKKEKYKIFTFVDFECGIPPYLILCIQTWKRNLRDKAEIIVLDRKNVTDYIDGYLLTESVLNPFKPCSTMFYDYMALLVLYCNGGMYIDVDTIITDTFEPDFSLLNEYEAVAYNSSEAGVCTGFLMSKKHSPLLEELIRRYRFENYLPNRDIPRDSIFQDVLLNTYKEQTFFYDAVSSGYLAEVKEFGELSANAYINYYFTREISIEKFLKNNAGIVSLHNSITPENIKTMTIKKLLKRQMLLSKIFRVLL